MSHPHLERCTARRRSAHAREIGTAEAFTQTVPGGIPERIRRIATLHPSRLDMSAGRTHYRTSVTLSGVGRSDLYTAPWHSHL